MFFLLLNRPLDEPPRPRRLFAKVDQVEPLDAQESVILFDCVNAEWSEKLDPNSDPLWKIAVGIEDDPTGPNAQIFILSMLNTDVKRFLDDDLREGDWFYVDLGEPHEGAPGDLFYKLFQDPTDRGVITFRKVTPDELDKLRRLAGWEGLIESRQDEIEGALAQLPAPEAVGIYDVGQGAATALLAANCSPFLYFDFGGAAIANWRNFPEPLRHFCFTSDPPVVLSHWDWDHWSSALRDRRAITRRTWVAPLQPGAGSLGAVHARFIATALNAGTRFFWWGNGTQSIQLTANPVVEIFSALGPRTSRNDSGLALRIDTNPIKVLLPADAAMEFVHSGTAKVDYAVMPHHGGRSSLLNLPSPHRKTKSHIVFSCGVGNSYLHPLADTVKAWRKNWKHNVHTGLRGANGLGHVGISLINQASPPCQQPCGGACQLDIKRWI
ncbi:UNVERIFIED_ORG: hypothetical protein GGI66_006169 [Rhizobium esperanzae]